MDKHSSLPVMRIDSGKDKMLYKIGGMFLFLEEQKLKLLSRKLGIFFSLISVNELPSRATGNSIVVEHPTTVN
jgi:hypothetical protein